MRRRRRSRIWIVILIILFVLLTIGIITGTKFLNEYNNDETKAGTDIQVEIPKGTGTQEIAQVLKEKGLINYEVSFLLKLKNSPFKGKLRYGSFTLNTGMCIDDMIEAIANGGDKKEAIKVTIPEGYSVEMIGKRLEDKGLCSAEEFIKAVTEETYDYDFLADIPDNKEIKYKLQGFLFPATYSFYKDVSPKEIVDQMLKAFDDRFIQENIDQANKLGKSIYEIVTIASIIEREAKLDEERPTISGVIYNRLNIDMKLQMCPTVLYVRTDGKYDVGQVFYKDLEIDSPYNTYKYKGLPVGPICNPGVKAIAAALAPESHDYLYYHTDDETKGNHIFTKTYEEHQDTRIK